MIPVHDAIPIRTRPGVTYGLLAVLAGLAAIHTFGQTVTLVRDGGTVVTQAWWIAVCAQIVSHRDWVHLGSNMLAVWTFGPVLEDRLGHGRFAACACACVLSGAAAAMVPRTPSDIVVGFTGLAAGLVAAYTLQFPRSRAVVPVPVFIGFELADVPAWFVSAFWASIQLVDQIPPGAIAAGAAAGMVGLLVARRPERQRPDWWSPMGGGSGSGGRATGIR